MESVHARVLAFNRVENDTNKIHTRNLTGSFFLISFHSIKKKNFSYFNIIYFKEVPIYSYSAGNFHQND